MKKALMIFLLGALFAGFPAAAETFEWQGEAATLRIEVHKGDIVVRPVADGEIKVSAVKHGRDEEVRQVKIEVEESGSEVTIYAVYPPRENRNDPETKVKVDFEIRLPPGVRFVGETEVGDIEALRLSDPVTARSTVGDIRISTAAYAEARTTNGKIFASLGRTDWEGSLSFETVNGDIEVEIPASADVELTATSTNGDFDSDLFPVERNRYGVPGSHVRGELGDGGRGLRLKSVNGDLRVNRRHG